MNHDHPCPFIAEMPRLSDRAAADLVDVLHQITLHIESHYAHQLRRHYQRRCRRQNHPDLFESPPLPPAANNDEPPF
jgi:hypothetical protein